MDEIINKPMRVYTRIVWQWQNGVLVPLEEEWYDYDGPVAWAGGGAPVSRITNYRGRSDTGTVDGTPTWIAAENTSFSVTVGTAFRIRIGLENTGTASDTATSPGSGTPTGISRCGYDDLSYGSLTLVINGADAGSSADATDVTTQRLTSGTGTWANGVAGYDENETFSCAVANGNFTECEFGVVLTGGAATPGVGGGETWTFGVNGLTNAPANHPTFTTPDTNGSDFQHGNQLGGATQKVANAATISMTTAADIRANYLVVVHVVCDNNGTTDADHSEISGVTCGGVAMTKAVEYTNGNAAAQAGVTSSVWWLQHSSQINSGSTITATFANATTNGDANVIQAREYIVASGKTVSVEATNANATDAATQPTALDATTSNIECLRVCAVGFEDGDTAAKFNEQIRASNRTWSLWWTTGALGRTTGTALTDVSSVVEATITTGTGASSQIGAPLAAASCDFACTYVAFKAAASANFQDGALSGGTITGTATLVGASTAVAPLSATGTGTATLVSSADDNKPVSMTGTGTATLVGASQADSVLSATGTGTATFVGASSTDAALAATGTGTGTFVSSADDTKPFSMTGTGTASLVGASFADSVLSSTGTGTADFVGLEVVTEAPFSMTGTGTATLIGASNADAVLSATGTGTATWTATSTADSPFSMTGTGTALFVGASQADSLLSATGTGTATLVGASQADSTLSATGIFTVSFVGETTADSILAATGTATVSWAYANDGEGALSATGTGTASLVGASDAEAVLSATGTGTADFVGDSTAAATDAVFDATGTGTATFVGVGDVAATPAVSAGGAGGFPGAWRKRERKKKKKLDDLDDLIAQLQAQIIPYREAKEVGLQILLRAELERAQSVSLDGTIEQIEAEIVRAKELLQEIDDEEALLLLM
jgi:hypothetical protein